MKLLLPYLIMIAAFVGCDAVWLTMSGPSYHAALQPLLAPEVNVVAAVLFYAVYLSGVGYFCVAPGLRAGWRAAAGRGAGFGFVAYATYDLTNNATLAGWPAWITAMDLAWGTLLTATAAGLAAAIGRATARPA